MECDVDLVEIRFVCNITSSYLVTLYMAVTSMREVIYK